MKLINLEQVAFFETSPKRDSSTVFLKGNPEKIVLNMDETAKLIYSIAQGCFRGYCAPDGIHLHHGYLMLARDKMKDS